ncbi:MAG: hypothetical protein LBJ33_00825 [Pseudomonas putida]|nr:hypothetical protein [Pseudomonas putida]
MPEDFIAVPISDRIRWVAAASPRYINRAPRLDVPEDLLNHKCIRIRTGLGVIYRWDFEKAGEHRAVDVPGQLCVNETEFGIQMALADRGIDGSSRLWRLLGGYFKWLCTKWRITAWALGVS